MNYYIKNNNIKFILLEGNHTYYSKKWSALSLFSIIENPNIKVICKKPKVYYDVLYIPYDNVDKSLYDNEYEYKNKSYNVITAHWDINGAIMDNGLKIKSKNKITVKNKDRTILLGHIHKHHTVDGTNAEYVGSPYQITFGDTQTEKQYIIYNDNTKEIKRYKYIPKYILKNIVLSNENKDEKIIEELLNSNNTNIFYKIGYYNTISANLIYTLKNSKNILNVYALDTINEENVNIELEEVDIDLSKYIIQGLEEFLKKEGLSIKQIDKAISIVKNNM